MVRLSGKSADNSEDRCAEDVADKQASTDKHAIFRSVVNLITINSCLEACWLEYLPIAKFQLSHAELFVQSLNSGFLLPIFAATASA